MRPHIHKVSSVLVVLFLLYGVHLYKRLDSWESGWIYHPETDRVFQLLMVPEVGAHLLNPFAQFYYSEVVVVEDRGLVTENIQSHGRPLAESDLEFEAERRRLRDFASRRGDLRQALRDWPVFMSPPEIRADDLVECWEGEFFFAADAVPVTLIPEPLSALGREELPADAMDLVDFVRWCKGATSEETYLDTYSRSLLLREPAMDLLQSEGVFILN